MITKNKIIQLLIIMVSIVLSMLLYSTEYSIKYNVEDIETNISEFLDRDVKVVKYQKVDNIIFVYFTNESKDKVGYTVLYRGLNFRYQIRQVSYGAWNQVLHINEFKTLFNRYWAIFGTNYENRISTITFNGGESNVINVKIFLHISANIFMYNIVNYRSLKF